MEKMDKEGWPLSLLTQFGPAECWDDLKDRRTVGIFLTQRFGEEAVEDLFFLLFWTVTCQRGGERERKLLNMANITNRSNTLRQLRNH